MEKNKLEFITEIASTHNGDINKVREIGQSNASYASVNFEQDVIVEQIKKIYHIV